MTATTYSTLVNDIITYCERTDEPFLAQVPRFIALAENRIASENKPFGFLRVVSGNLTGNVVQKPVRWRKTKSISITVNSQKTFLYNRSYEYCVSYWPNPTLTDVPLYYADYDYEHLFIAPSPVQSFPMEIQYYELPEPLSEATQTNWTTRYAPQLLLYAALMEAMPFLKTSERIPEFQGLYDRAMGAINKEDQSRVTDDATVRS